MSFKIIRECAGAYINVNCCSEQWLLGHNDCSAGIATTGCGYNCINDGRRCIKHMSFKRIRECTGAYIKIDCCSKQRQLCYIDRPDGIAGTGCGCYRVNNRTRCVEPMSFKIIREPLGAYFDVNRSSKEW